MTPSKFLGLLLVIVYIIALQILAVLDIRTVFEHRLLLPVLNTLFAGIIPIVVAYVAGKTYMRTSSVTVLFMGCGMLSFGLCAVVAGWVIRASDGPNLNVTVYNTGALIGSLFHAIGGILSLAGRTTVQPSAKERLTLATAYLSVVLFVICFSLAALQGLIPRFFIQGVGPTGWRQVILGNAVFLYAFSSMFLMGQYIQWKSDFLYWYSLSLAMLALGLFAFFVQKTVGCPIGWLGRSANYAAGFLAVIAIFSALRDASTKGVSLESAIAGLLADAEAGYRNLVETATDAIVTLDNEGRIIDWNSAAESILGYTRQQAIGSPFFEILIPDQFVGVLKNEIRSSIVSNRKPLHGNTIEIEARTKNGSLLPVELSLSARRVSFGWVNTWIIRDISLRKQAEAALERSNVELERTVRERSVALQTATKYNDLLQTLHRAQTQFICKANPEEFFGNLLRDFLTLTNSEFGFIGEILYTEGGQPYLKDQAISDISWDEESRSVYQTFARDKGLDFFNIRGLWGTVILTGEPVISNDPANDPRSTGLPAGHPPLNSFLGLPFHSEGKLIGMTGMANRPSGYDKAFVDFLQPYVTTCAGILEAYRNENRRRETEEQLAQAHAELERKVLDRTAQLALSNERLVLEIEERKRAEEAATAERQRLYDVLETLPVYVCLLDSDYRMPFANRYFRETFGESLGQRCHDFLFGRTQPCEVCETYTVMKTRAPHHWYWTGPNGRDYDIYDFPFFDKDHSLLILEMGIDITGRKHAEAALNRTLADLTRSNEDLQQFAYVASHDLQEPLRNVASCMQMLEEKYKNKLDADADQYIHYAIEGAVRMKALVQDLLEYSRIGTRGKPLEPTDCEQILDRTVKNLRFTISEAGAVITHDPLPTIPADDSQLSQVFQNLIGNAIKFRRDEPPQIHVSAVKIQREWVFSVKDNGVGIESRHLDRIFEIFQRLHKRSRYDGTGMGLAIVKKIVERHRGRVWVESESGVGTTFYFALPENGTHANARSEA